MSSVIKVENLSKAYQLGQFGTGTISRDLERWWVTKVLGKEDPFLKIGETNDRSKKGTSDIVWSLKDINFEIEQGDAVGIIGKNGAGNIVNKHKYRIKSDATSPKIWIGFRLIPAFYDIEMLRFFWSLTPKLNGTKFVKKGDWFVTTDRSEEVTAKNMVENEGLRLKELPYKKVGSAGILRTNFQRTDSINLRIYEVY